ncbi:MAG: FhaA domain-containing protein [Acidothermaceae bacterium]
MGVLQRFERRLGGVVEGLFARAFKSEVQPVEVAAALQRELDNQAAIVGHDRTLVPNHFFVDLGDHDYERLAPYEQPLTKELAAMVREHADDQRYTFVGPVVVGLKLVSSLETGVFHVRSEVVAGPDATPAPASMRGPEGQPASREARDVRPESATTAAPLATAARPANYGRLMVREGKNASYEVELGHQVTVIGRGTDTDVRLGDQAVSRRHAEIRVVNGKALVSDLQSTNGTLVNGARITTAALVDGDEVRVGETTLTYHDSRRG